MARAGLSVVAVLGLGVNQGDRTAALCSAVRALEQHGIVVARLAPVYETAYQGPGSPQPAYLNTVAEVRTTLAPLALLGVLQEIERAHGRVPGTHGRPRPLDLDILCYGSFSIRHPELVVPHPRLRERLFVLEPMHDLGLLQADAALQAQRERLRPQQAAARYATLERVGDRCEARVA
jgi:2-amino-4-hydroxy-6-hydroxymethyldihydropteridine diphosphokinase